jgi:hypothetical protein
VIFFFDENISPYLARMLGHFDRLNEMRPSIEHFEGGTPDIEWMKEVATWDESPNVVCGDCRILRNKVERKVLKECGLMFIYLAPGWTKMRWDDIAWKAIKVWPDIVRNVEQARYPMLFEVTVGLKVQQMGKINLL